MTRHDEPTQYAQRPDANAQAYSEIPAFVQPDLDLVCEPYPAAQKWSRAIAIAALGLATAFLLAFLTVHVVRDNGSVAETPAPVVPTTTVVPERQVIPRDSTTITVAPTVTSMVPATTTVTIPSPPPATMTNPLAPSTTTTTVTIPEPPPATMTNPLEPPPATMTNPLEPAPATMTNPLEPPLGAAYGDDA